MAAAVAAQASQVHHGAWWSLASIMMLNLIAGTIYAWSSFNSIFKDDEGYGLSQSQMELLGTMAHFGNYLALDAGIMSVKLGTHFTLAYGCSLTFIGYTGLWYAVKFANGEFPYWALALLCVIYGHGCGSIDNGSMTTVMSDFPKNRGNVVGCMKGWYGMSGAIVTVIYDALFFPDQSAFLIFLGVYSIVFGSAFVPVVAYTKGLVDDSAQWISFKFRIMSVGIVVFMVYICSVSANVEKINSFPNMGKPLWLGILVSIIVVAASLFLFALGGPKAENRGGETGIALVPETTEHEVDEDAPNLPIDVSALQMTTYLDFWILMPILVIGQGAGLLFINNAGQILDAYEGRHLDATSFVAIISCANGFGRLTYGNLSEAAASRMSRILFLIISCALLSLAYLLVFLVGAPAVEPAGAVVGFAYGGLWGVQPVILAEIFGSRDYSIKYACSAAAAFCGSLLFSTLLAGRIYDEQARGPNLDDDGNCISSDCYSTTLIIVAVSGVPSIVLGAVLWKRTQWIYNALDLL